MESQEEQDKCLETSEFYALKELRTKSAFIASNAEKAILESRVADLEYKVAIQNIYIKYNMSSSDTIDEETGKIKKREEKEKK